MRHCGWNEHRTAIVLSWDEVVTVAVTGDGPAPAVEAVVVGRAKAVPPQAETTRSLAAPDPDRTRVIRVSPVPAPRQPAEVTPTMRFLPPPTPPPLASHPGDETRTDVPA